MAFRSLLVVTQVNGRDGLAADIFYEENGMKRKKKEYVCPGIEVVDTGAPDDVVTVSGTDVLAKKLDEWLNG